MIEVYSGQKKMINYFEIMIFISRGQYNLLQIEPCGWQYITIILLFTVDIEDFK